MGDYRGFLKATRKEAGSRPVKDRIYDFGEVEQWLHTEDQKLQASRCMDCGIPFCHWACPVHSKIPEWQDAIYRGDWQEASNILHSTNDMPEITGRVCPAPCEKGCVLGINDDPVTIRENERSIVERGFTDGFIKAQPPKYRTDKKIAVIGSGPAGLSVGARLNKYGHNVVIYEQDDAIGGLLRYGIPDFKLSKKVIDRRLQLFADEGITFKPNVSVGNDISGKELLKTYDAVCLAIGSMEPRDLPVEGRDLSGIHFAMDFMKQQNKVLQGKAYRENDHISAKGKNVVVIGGRDTGSDCVGTSNRQGARSVTQIEIMPKPPEQRNPDNPWPLWPNTLKTSSSHEEGCERKWSLLTKRFIGDHNNHVRQIEVVQVEWSEDENGKMQMHEIPGTTEYLDADLVLLSLGFVHPIHEGLVNEMGLETDKRGNIMVTENYQTSKDKVFAAGDAASGASLVVKAIYAGREAAQEINRYLRK